MNKSESGSPSSRRFLFLIFAGVWLSVFALICAPCRRTTVTAMPENLWTRAQYFSWSSPILSNDILPFQRTEYGFALHALVIDRGLGHSHWSARIEPAVVFAYALVASLVTTVFIFWHQCGLFRKSRTIR